MKLRVPASLLSYILRYLQYRPDPALIKYREHLEEIKGQLKSEMPRVIYNEMDDSIDTIFIIYTLLQLLIAAAGVILLVMWFAAPLETTIADHLESWSEASWMFWLFVPLYFAWISLDWWHDTRMFRLFRDWEGFLA